MIHRCSWFLLGAALVVCCRGGAATPPGEAKSEFEQLHGPDLAEAKRLYSQGETERGAAILRKLAGDADWNVRSNAVHTIGEVRDRALLPEVYGALKDARLEVRERASRILQWMGDRSSIAPLREALSDPEGIVRSNSAEALARIGGVEELATLQRVLKEDPDPGVRALTANALGQMHDAAVVPLLVAALGDASALVRARAAEALGETGMEGGRAALEEVAASDPDDGVRATAKAALRRLDARKDARQVSLLSSTSEIENP